MVLSLPEKPVKIHPHFSRLPDFWSPEYRKQNLRYSGDPKPRSAPHERIAQLVPCLIHRGPLFARAMRSGV